MSQIEEIRAFVMVVETGSLTQASERLGIAVSAVSRRLKDLEIRLGAPLIQRTTRRMYLNEVGQVFYDRCRIVLDELEAAQQEVLNSGGSLNGVLRVSTPLSFGVTHMSSAIAQFMHAHPEIRIEMDLSDKRVDLVAEGFDLAIRIGALTDSSLIAKKITAVKKTPCAAPIFWSVIQKSLNRMICLTCRHWFIRTRERQPTGPIQAPRENLGPCVCHRA